MYLQRGIRSHPTIHFAKLSKTCCLSYSSDYLDVTSLYLFQDEFRLADHLSDAQKFQLNFTQYFVSICLLFLKIQGLLRVGLHLSF